MSTPASPPIRVVFVDDHPMLREGTQALLERTPGIEVVGVTEEGLAAITMVREHRPDVLLLDLRLPDVSGLEVARQVRAAFPEVAVLVLTGYDELGYVRELQRLGIRGYLSKSVSGGQIVAAIRSVAAGGTILVSEAARAVAGGATNLLTAREYEVLRLLMAGRRNKEIARDLTVSEKTVEFHITNLFGKLDARSRTEVILKARQRGLGPLESRDHWEP